MKQDLNLFRSSCDLQWLDLKTLEFYVLNLAGVLHGHPPPRRQGASTSSSTQSRSSTPRRVRRDARFFTENMDSPRFDEKFTSLPVQIDSIYTKTNRELCPKFLWLWEIQHSRMRRDAHFFTENTDSPLFDEKLTSLPFQIDFMFCGFDRWN